MPSRYEIALQRGAKDVTQSVYEKNVLSRPDLRNSPFYVAAGLPSENYRFIQYPNQRSPSLISTDDTSSFDVLSSQKLNPATITGLEKRGEISQEEAAALRYNQSARDFNERIAQENARRQQAGQQFFAPKAGINIPFSPIRNPLAGINPYDAQSIKQAGKLLDAQIQSGTAKQEDVDKFNKIVRFYNYPSRQSELAVAKQKYFAVENLPKQISAAENVNLKELKLSFYPKEFGGQDESFKQAAEQGAEFALKVARKGTGPEAQKYVTLLKETPFFPFAKQSVRVAGAAVGLTGRSIKFLGDVAGYGVIAKAQQLGIKKLEVPVSKEVGLYIRELQKPEYAALGPVVLFRNPLKYIFIGKNKVLVPQRAFGNIAAATSDVFYLVGGGGKSPKLAKVEGGKVTKIVGELPKEPSIKSIPAKRPAINIPEIEAIKFRVGKEIKGLSNKIPEVKLPVISEVKLPVLETQRLQRNIRQALGPAIKEVALTKKAIIQPIRKATGGLRIPDKADIFLIEARNAVKETQQAVAKGRPQRLIKRQIGGVIKNVELAKKSFRRAVADGTYTRAEYVLWKRQIQKDFSLATKQIADKINRKTKYDIASFKNEINLLNRKIGKTRGIIIKGKIKLAKFQGITKEAVSTIQERALREQALFPRRIRKKLGGAIKAKKLAEKRLTGFKPLSPVRALESKTLTVLARTKGKIARPFRKFGGELIKAIAVGKASGIKPRTMASSFLRQRVNNFILENKTIFKIRSGTASGRARFNSAKRLVTKFANDLANAQKQRNVKVRNALIRRILGRYQDKFTKFQVIAEEANAFRELKLRDLKARELYRSREFSPTRSIATSSGTIQKIPESALSLGKRAGEFNLIRTLGKGRLNFVEEQEFYPSGFQPRINESRIPFQNNGERFNIGEKARSELNRTNPIRARIKERSFERLGENRIALPFILPREGFKERILENLGEAQRERLKEGEKERIRGRVVSRTVARRIAERRLLVSRKQVAQPKQFLAIQKGKAFDVYTRRSGKTIKLNRKPLTRTGALGLGHLLIENSVARSIFLKKAKGMPTPSRFKGLPLNQYRTPSRKSKLPRTAIIERSLFAINTRGEKRGLTEARYAATIRKKSIRSLLNPLFLKQSKVREKKLRFSR